MNVEDLAPSHKKAYETVQEELRKNPDQSLMDIFKKTGTTASTYYEALKRLKKKPTGRVAAAKRKTKAVAEVVKKKYKPKTPKYEVVALPALPAQTERRLQGAIKEDMVAVAFGNRAAMSKFLAELFS